METRWYTPRTALLAGSALDGVVRQVAAQLLIAPTVEHLLNRVRLGMKQRNRVDEIETATLVDGQKGLPSGLV